jgi:hypothetical protein
VPDRIKQQLNYSFLPLAILLDRGVEVYSELDDRIFSLVCFSHGFNLGIWEAFGSPSPFSVSPGARSLFMLPRITNAEKYKHLRQYGVGLPAPVNSFEQHADFVKIANHKNFSQPWVCEILFFSAQMATRYKN